MLFRTLFLILLCLLPFCIPSISQANEEQEIQEAAELISKLSPAQKGRLTRLVNSGSAEDLAELPGIGEVTAQRVIDARPLESSAHLVTVHGIGVGTIREIVDWLKAPRE